MTRNKKFYKKLYCSECCNIKDDIMPKMVIYGTKTWAHYFFEIEKVDLKKYEMELLENVEHVKFNTKKEMFKYWDKLANRKKIDWCVDFDYPELLRFK